MIGGMLTATLLGVIFVPVFFVWVLSLVRRKRGESSPASAAAPRATQE